MSLPDILYFEGSKYRKETTTSYIPQLYMHKEDKDTSFWGGGIRPCASSLGGCPAVFILKEPLLKARITKDWQFYLRAINYNMSIHHVSALLGNDKAFTNGTGFGDPNDKRCNWLTGEGVGYPDPQFDKDRTCARAVMSGVESGTNLLLTTFDGNSPPPLKPGKTYPQTIEEINIDDYLYNPKDHRWLFFAANIVTAKPGNTSAVVPFPNGAIYDWMGDNEPYSWIPLVSREQIYYPLNELVKLPVGSTIPSAYRRV